MWSVEFFFVAHCTGTHTDSPHEAIITYALHLHCILFFLVMRARKSFLPLFCVQVICLVWLHLTAVRIQIDRWLVNWWPKPQNCMWWNLLHGHSIGTARRYILGHTYCEFHFDFASAVGHRSIHVFCVMFRLGSGCLILEKLNGMLSLLFISSKFIFFLLLLFIFKIRFAHNVVK